ncbi:hypothetical protein CW304_02965 [Bacillus sp. UFRGS-B20]|nr:hypothetical protein CW304_02965 [Bacillus sp. UFRGS-B20]
MDKRFCFTLCTINIILFLRLVLVRIDINLCIDFSPPQKLMKSRFLKDRLFLLISFTNSAWSFFFN